MARDRGFCLTSCNNLECSQWAANQDRAEARIQVIYIETSEGSGGKAAEKDKHLSEGENGSGEKNCLYA